MKNYKGYISRNKLWFVTAANQKDACKLLKIELSEFRDVYDSVKSDGWPVRYPGENKIFFCDGGVWLDQRARRAFKFTSIVKPDVPIPVNRELSKGFLFYGESSSFPRVEPACSSEISHGNGNRITSQGAKELYSTRLLALRALRNAVEMDCAKRLLDIDEWIEKEIEQSK